MSRIKVRDYREDKITFKDIEVGQIFKYEFSGGVFIKAFKSGSGSAVAVGLTDGWVREDIGKDTEVTPIEAELVIKWMGVKEE